jgi:DNA-directed RNA polymerase alpha subunit
LSRRTINALLWDERKTVADLTAATEADLGDIRNFGAGCLGEVRRVLRAHGLALAGEEAPCPR